MQGVDSKVLRHFHLIECVCSFCGKRDSDTRMGSPMCASCRAWRAQARKLHPPQRKERQDGPRTI